jgi:hypothetical protein
MDQGETIMPVPEGKITTTSTWKEPVSVVEEAIKKADAEVATEEYIAEKPAPKKRAKKV